MAWNEGLDEYSPAFLLASSDAPAIRALAGPGSGKSFAIKRRIARLLENGTDPEKILAITFTRTSAQDLKSEISSIEIVGADRVHARTVHSHALKILMMTDVLERTGRFARMVIDHEIQPALNDIVREGYGIREKRQLLNSYLAAWARLQTDTPGFVQDAVELAFETELINWLKNHKGILVGEVIPVALRFLRNNPAFSEIGKYETILVDEFQDLNKSEQEFIKLIKGDANIVIVGDDDQSIYSFKHAHPEGIKSIPETYQNCYDVPFSECRRCPTRVTTLASELISKNTNRTLGQLNAYPQNQEGIINIVQWPEYDLEISGLTTIIRNEIQSGAVRPEDILILTPRRRAGYRLRDSLLALGLPVKSYFREESIKNDSVRRAFSLMNYLANPDDKIALRFLLGFGSSDYRRKQYEILTQISQEQGLSVKEILQEIVLGRRSGQKLKQIVAAFQQVLSDIAVLKNAIILDAVNAFQASFMNDAENESEFYELNEIYRRLIAESPIPNLAEADNFESWIKTFFSKFQEAVALPDSPEDINHIRIMSLHASKGLSAKFVILCSMIDHLMPYIPGDAEILQVERERIIEEQRRLFYVAITRCKSSNDYPGRLIISSFLAISSVEAARMGLGGIGKQFMRVHATRFLNDLGNTMPVPIRGIDLLP